MARCPGEPGSLVLLTSGTTGTPKGAPRQTRSPLVAAQFLDRIPLRAGESTVLAAPLFHGTGLSQFILSFALGSTVVLRRKFDPERRCAAIAGHQCTALVVVPTMLQRIVDLGQDVLDRYDTRLAADHVLRGLRARRRSSATARSRPSARCVHNLYGSTEVAVATRRDAGGLGEGARHGRPPPVGCKVALYDEDGARITAPT